MSKYVDFFKKHLIMIISISVFIIVAFFIGKSVAEPDDLLRKQSLDGLVFTNAKLDYEEGVSTLTVEVTNDTDGEYTLKTIGINFKDGENITTLVGYVGPKLKKGETKTMTASIDKDITDSIDLEYVIIK